MADDMLPKDIPLQKIHTLQSDLVEKPVVARNIFPEPVKTPSHIVRNLTVTFISALVIIGAGYGIVSIARERSKQEPVVVPIEDTHPKTLVPYTSSITLTFSDQELSDKEQFKKKIFDDTQATQDGVTFYQTNFSAASLLSNLSPSIPSDFTRTIDDTEDFFGGTTGGNFILIKTDSHDQAYAGMLEWEHTMGDDLFPLFQIASSSHLQSFEDRVVANKDVRVAVDVEGKTLFVYGFYNLTTIIFAKNEDVFRNTYDMLR